MTELSIPELSLVLLVGVTGSGKSTFARAHFKPTEVISSDFCRGLVADDQNDQSATPAAFEVLRFIVGKRLEAGRLTVVDATNVQPEARRDLVLLAREYDVLPVAIVLDLPERLCAERNAQRPDRDFGPHVIRRQRQQLRRHLKGLPREGFRTVHVLSTPDEVQAATITRAKLFNDLRHETGPFDVIGDVHGCRAELEQLLDKLGYAIDRDALNQVVFNGEFVPGNQWVSPENPYYQSAFAVGKRDIAKAKALLKEAGVTAPFDVDFMVPRGAEPQAVAEVIQAMAAEAGIMMKIRVTEFATSLKAAEAGEYQAYLLAWSGRSDPDGNAYSFHKCKAPLNYSGFCNPDVDKLLDESRIPSDQAQRKSIYEKLTKIILEEHPILYLYHPRVLIAHTTRLEGYRQMPDGLVRVTGLTLK